MLIKKKKLNEYQISIIICCLFFIIIHMMVVPDYGDDALYAEVLRGGGALLPWLADRYYSWSSRLLIDAVSVVMAAAPIVWKVIDIIMLMVLYSNLHFICFGKERDSRSYLLLLVLLSYPFSHMGGSGWIATTVNYLWPMSILLFPITMLLRLYQNDKTVIKWYQYVLYIAAIFFGCNNEILAVVSLCCFITALIIFYVKKLKVPQYCCLAGIFISLISIVFALTCPGESVRLLREIQNHMPEFNQLSLVHILGLNYIAVFQHFVSKPNALLFLLCLIIFIGTRSRTKVVWKRAAALLPLFIDTIYTIYYFILQNIIKTKDNDYAAPGTINISNYERIEQIAILFAFTIFIAALVLGIYWISEHASNFWIILFVLGLGFAARMALSLSPTMFASGTRTFFFFYVAIILVIVMLAKHLRLLESKLYRTILYLCSMGGILYNIYQVARTSMYYQ